jgi:hypothetical protein
MTDTPEQPQTASGANIPPLEGRGRGGVSPESQPEQPETASCAVPLTALAITVALLIIALPITRKLFGTSLKALEQDAAPLAIEYIKTTTNNQPTTLADTTKFDEPAFKSKLIQVIGTYKSSKITNLGTEKTTPPTLYITLNVEGEQGKGIATIALQKQSDNYKVVNAGIYPR